VALIVNFCPEHCNWLNVFRLMIGQRMNIRYTLEEMKTLEMFVMETSAENTRS